MISIQFLDFAPRPGDHGTGIEEQVAAMNSWLSGRPDVNVVTIETIVLPLSPEIAADPYLVSRLDLSEMVQVIRVWYEGER